MRGGWIALVAVPLIIAACAPRDSQPAAGASRETLPDGTVVVHYAALPDDDIPVIEQDLVLPDASGDPERLFGDIRGIDATSDGTIYVLDYQGPEIWAFDENGAFVRTVASKGEGPGELSEANGMILAGDTLLWVQDYGKWVMMGIDLRSGESRRIPMHVRSYGYIWSGTVDDAGRIWKPDSYSDAERVYPPEEGLQEAPAQAFLKSYDPTTEVEDSVYLGPETYRSFISRTSNGYRYYGIPFDAHPITLVDRAGGFWTTDNTTYRIARLDEQGDTVLIIEADVPSLPVTAEDRAGWVDALVERTPDARRAAEEIVALSPETKPALAHLFMDDQRRLWVERSHDQDAPPRYDVFDTAGTYQGSAKLAFTPSAYFPIRVRHNRIYALVLDSLDVPTVVRGELPESLTR